MQMVEKILSDNGGAALFPPGTALRPLLTRANMIVINAYYPRWHAISPSSRLTANVLVLKGPELVLI